MKKLLLLSLLFTALVFQSCKKISYNIDDGDLVPIVFSQAVTTKTLGTLADPIESFDALVLGSLAPNLWTTIYGSTVAKPGGLAGVLETTYANGSITFGPDNPAAFFTDPVYYPIGEDGKGEYIYIKALAPFGAITSAIPSSLSPEGLDKVTFTITGAEDVMATKGAIGIPTPAPGQTNADFLGCGKRDSGTEPEPIQLIFDHLLSKIVFYIVAENEAAVTGYWGDFVSITLLNAHTKFECTLSSNHTNLPTSPDVEEKKNLLAVNIPRPDMTIPHITTLEQQAAAREQACSLMVYPTILNPTGTVEPWEIIVRTKKPPTVPSGGDVIIEYTTSFDFQLLEGQQHNVTIIFKENKAIGFDATIEEWGTGPAGPDVDF